MLDAPEKFAKPEYLEGKSKMLMFDTTEVRASCDKFCTYQSTIHGREFIHSNSCVRRWRTEGDQDTVTTKSVSPSPGELSPGVGQHPVPKVTLVNYGYCNVCGDYRLALCSDHICDLCYQKVR